MNDFVNLRTFFARVQQTSIVREDNVLFERITKKMANFHLMYTRCKKLCFNRRNILTYSIFNQQKR